MGTQPTVFPPISADDLRTMLIAAGLHGAEMAARGAASYALLGIPRFVRYWHGNDLPVWLSQEPLVADVVENALARIAKYAWIQWRYRRTPERSEFPDPAAPAWLTEYAEREATELAGELSAFGELRDAGEIQNDGQTGEPPGPIPDVVQSLFF